MGKERQTLSIAACAWGYIIGHRLIEMSAWKSGMRLHICILENVHAGGSVSKLQVALLSLFTAAELQQESVPQTPKLTGKDPPPPGDTSLSLPSVPSLVLPLWPSYLDFIFSQGGSRNLKEPGQSM